MRLLISSRPKLKFWIKTGHNLFQSKLKLTSAISPELKFRAEYWAGEVQDMRSQLLVVVTNISLIM